MHRSERLRQRLAEIEHKHSAYFASKLEADGVTPYQLINIFTARKGIYDGILFLLVRDPSLPPPILLEVEQVFVDVFLS